MPEKISLTRVKSLIKDIKHPAINSTLLELGIIKSIGKKGSKVVIELAFPFANIPIRDVLINLISTPLKKENLDFEIKTGVMAKKELQNFLAIEQKNWRG